MTFIEKNIILKKNKYKEMQKWEKLEGDESSWRTNGLSDINELYKITGKLKLNNITHYKVFLQVDEKEEEKEEEEDVNSDSSGFNPNSDG